MGRFLHLAAILALIGSALFAYRIKYDTISLGEEVVKLNHQIAREKTAIAVLRAEWQLVGRPDRIQALADKHSDLVPASINQLVRWQDVPNRPAPSDGIGQKLEALGLFAPTNTPTTAKATDARTPTGRKP
ncbi:hypothetical protein NK718_01465 [Alsobacter sp. SYSU M60028]|uniref:Cell division protein FtsL n=1 Tax=Alsobacter ponti TaxID=2962936 RepID=A0ABT1LAA5_9HYPH|nr:hypothetical protein [Alsobacter ponti]MCP8937173.1 hypothetical protein [Alsobacter ponti]